MHLLRATSMRLAPSRHLPPPAPSSAASASPKQWPAANAPSDPKRCVLGCPGLQLRQRQQNRHVAPLLVGSCVRNLIGGAQKTEKVD